MSLRLPNLLATRIGRLTAFFLLHNSFGAMPDVAIDALAVNTLREDDRGLANGVMFGGAAIGTAVGGAGVLLLIPAIGLKGGFVFVAACIAAVTVVIVLPLREWPRRWPSGASRARPRRCAR